MDLEAFREAYAERTERIGGHDWRYIATEGPGPALVLLPGAFGAAEIFWNQIVALGGRLCMVSVTYPPLADAESLADGVAALADRLGIARFSLLGSSLGGYIAQIAALRHADRLETLFIANSLLSAAHLVGFPDRATAERLGGAALRAGIVAKIESWPEPEFAALKRILKDHAAKRVTDAMIEARTVLLSGLDAPPPLPVPDSRIVLIECDDDPIISRDGREAMRRRHPGAAVHRLPSGGHFPYITRAGDYTAIIAGRLIGDG